ESSLPDVPERGGIIFFTNGYVHGIKLHGSNKESCVDVGAKCYRSMKKSETPHCITLTIDAEEKDITERHCTCKAGQFKRRKLFANFSQITGSCSHTVAVIYQLTHYKNLGLTDVPSELACTSIPQQWHKPRGPKIDPEPVTAMVFAKPKPTLRKKKQVHSIPLDNSIPDVTAEHVKKLKLNPAARGTPLQYLLNYETIETQQTALGNVQLGSMLPFQLRHYRSQEHHQPVRQTPCGDTTFPSQTLHIDNEIIKKYHHLNTFLSTTSNEAIALEKNTKQQAGNPQWFKERKNRITASQFSKICKRMNDFTTKFVDKYTSPYND
ncbi:hypothetical protein KUTeg_015673, partial [Tegillarca granosa]